MTTGTQPTFTWTRPKSLNLRRVSFDKIDVPAEYERKDLVEDDELKNSIASARAIHQPLAVLPDGNRFTLFDGVRRLRVGESVGLTEANAIVHELEEGVDAKTYMDRMRSILNKLRQDLKPSQRASLIRQVMTNFGMTRKEIAAMIGPDASSLTNWLAIEKYDPRIQGLIDSGEVNSFQARVFDGLNQRGQMTVLRQFGKEIRSMAGGKLHRLVRAKLSPRKHPELYVDPAKTEEKMARKKVGRKAKRRPRITRNEKEALSKSVEVSEIELQDLTQDIQRMKRGCILAGPPINSILRNPKLVSLIKRETDFLDELERYVEIY